MRIAQQVFALVRGGEWWEYKATPTFGLLYGTALVLREPLLPQWRCLALVLAVLGAAAAWAHLLNDWTDIDEDRRSGKANQMAGLSRPARAVLLLAPPVAGWAGLWMMQPCPALVVVYGLIWLVFALYSLNPARLKGRGALGLLADALGAHTLPGLFGAIAFASATGRVLPPPWFAALGAWSLFFGLRGILWHQLADEENDRWAGTATFVRRHSREAARRLGTWVFFPAEVASLLALLVLAVAPIAWVVLGISLAADGLRFLLRRVPTVVVVPRLRSRMALQDFALALLPVAWVTTATLRNPGDAWVLAVHLALFPRGTAAWCAELLRLLRKLLGAPAT